MSSSDFRERLHLVPNGAGWLLELRQYWSPDRLDTSRKPVLMIPGYCMNTFILNFHPGGTSMVRYLVERGAEVWTANLRGQGGSRKVDGSKKFGFREVANQDLPSVVSYIQANQRSQNSLLDAVGCSLGATFLFSYLALNPESHGLGGLITMGGPLRWKNPHPMVDTLFRSPELAAALPIWGTRHIAKRVLPIAKRLPFVLDVYMNKAMIDLSKVDQLVRTVDDPIPYLNMQIARWVSNRDLIVAGTNVSEAVADIDLPLFCVAANADGIVPVETALSAAEIMGSSDIETLEVGDARNWFAHADLFINNEADTRVFGPLHSWLTRNR